MPCGNPTYKGKGLRGTPSYAQSWNYNKFAFDSYNLTNCGESWCVPKGSIYTNPNADFRYFFKQNKSGTYKDVCGDPYTYYAYWYRRFPNQTNYLNCYFLPYSEPNYYYNKYGYKNSKGNCVDGTNIGRYNVTDNGFKFYDRIINPTK